MNIVSHNVRALALSALVLMCAPARAEAPKLPVPAIDQSAVGQRGYFYVGGKYVGELGKEIMQGQAYVEVVAPKDQRRPYPLVLIHGAAQTATNWMGTPDGRKGSATSIPSTIAARSTPTCYRCSRRAVRGCSTASGSSTG